MLINDIIDTQDISSQEEEEMANNISLLKTFKEYELTPDKIADSINVAANLMNSTLKRLDVSVKYHNDEITDNMKNITIQELRECCCSEDRRLFSVEAFIGDAYLWAIPKAGQLTINAPNRDIAEMVLSAFINS